MLQCCCRAGAPGKKSSKCSKIGYLCVIVFSTILALCMQKWGAPSIDMYSFNIGCEKIPNLAEGACKGDSAVYRISMGTFLWFIIMTIGTLLVNAKWHNGWWGIKLGLYAALVAGSFFVPNSVFGSGGEGNGATGYALLSRILSGFFLVLQIVAFIDFSYSWNASWVSKAEEADADDGGEGSGQKWLCSILASCGAMLLTTIIGIAMMYVYYGSCGLNVFFITWTAICIIGTTALQLSSQESDGSLLSSAVVALYATYLCWSSISSNPDPVCNPGAKSSDDPTMIGLGMAVAAFSLAWTCYSASVSAVSISQGPTAAKDAADADGNEINMPLNPGKPKSDYSSADAEEGMAIVDNVGAGERAARGRRALQNSAEGDAEDEEEEPTGEKFWFFHFTMAAGSVYMAMLLTDWGSGNVQSGEGEQAALASGMGSTSMWIKTISEWLALLLYTWTLVAPRCFPDRDFN